MINPATMGEVDNPPNAGYLTSGLINEVFCDGIRYRT